MSVASNEQFQEKWNPVFRLELRQTKYLDRTGSDCRKKIAPALVKTALRVYGHATF
jgi:hypothetical protein